MQANGKLNDVVVSIAGATHQLTTGLSALDLPLSAKKTAFMASSSEAAKQLTIALRPLHIPRKTLIRNLGTDAGGGNRRVAATQNKRLAEALRRSVRVQQLRTTGAKVGRLQTSNPAAQALWSAAAIGITPAHLQKLRLAAARAQGKVPIGTSVPLRMAAWRVAPWLDPTVRHHHDVLLEWAIAIRTRSPPLHTLFNAMSGALAKLSSARRPWQKVSGPAGALLMVLARLGWTPHSATHFTTHTGIKFNISKIAPAAVARYASNATLWWSDTMATAGKQGEPGIQIFWEALQGLLKGPLSKHDAGALAWTQSHRNALVFIIAGGEWTQHRQYLHGKAPTSSCKLCNHPQCNLWHRRYECDAWQHDRQTRVPTYLLEAAARVTDPTLRERFAKGLLPAPAALIPLPRTTAQVSTHWINKPSSERLTGSLFLDGSATGGLIPFLRRAGWAIVQVDAAGELVAAAYGAVPWESAPAQVARDAEDYAVYMLTKVASQPFTIYVDCAGTVEAARDPLVGTKPRHLRAHLWDEIWQHYAELRVNKTKAHATAAHIEQGITNKWEMQGNELADEHAKLGVELHGINAQQYLEIRALSKIAYHAAKWAAIQYVSMPKEQHQDSDTLQPKQKVLCKRKRPAPQGTPDTAPTDVTSSQQGITNHNVRAATASDGSVLLFCITCGAYKWKRTSKLGALCPKHPRGAGARQRLNMIFAGRFPNSALRMTIGPHRTPTMEELITIRAAHATPRPQSIGNWRDQWDRLKRSRVQTPTRTEIFKAYSQTEESIKHHTAMIAAANARRLASRSGGSARQLA